MLTWQIKIVAAILLCFSLYSGYHWIGSHAVAEYKVSLAIEQAKADKLKQDAYDKLATDYEALRSTRQANAQKITRTYEKIIEKPVYLNVCLDDSGVQLANQAIAGKPASGSNDKMPSDQTP